MMELIDRDALMKKAQRKCGRKCEECDFAQNMDSWCRSELFGVEVLSMPTVDAVPVVRCKDCDFYGTYKALPAMCALMERKMFPDGFCSEAMNCRKEVQRHYYAGFADAKMDGETK